MVFPSLPLCRVSRGEAKPDSLLRHTQIRSLSPRQFRNFGSHGTSPLCKAWFVQGDQS